MEREPSRRRHGHLFENSAILTGLLIAAAFGGWLNQNGPTENQRRLPLALLADTPLNDSSANLARFLSEGIKNGVVKGSLPGMGCSYDNLTYGSSAYALTADQLAPTTLLLGTKKDASVSITYEGDLDGGPNLYVTVLRIGKISTNIVRLTSTYQTFEYEGTSTKYHEHHLVDFALGSDKTNGGSFGNIDYSVSNIGGNYYLTSSCESEVIDSTSGFGQYSGSNPN